MPPPSEIEADVSRHASNRDAIGSKSAIHVTPPASSIERPMICASEPQNVRDYFALKFGANPQDDTLMDLPITSPCGQDCVKVIDAAADLTAHVNATLGETAVEDHLVELARRIVGVYRRG